MKVLPLPATPSVDPHHPPAATTRPTTSPQVPVRWVRWWKSPIATLDYGQGGRIEPWREAWIPAVRTLNGNRTPTLTYGGDSVAAAIEAAHLLARAIVQARISDSSGRAHTVRLNPAMAVLHDARSGAYWVTPLTSSVKSGTEWIELPHTIDGVAFEGARPWLRTPAIASATKDLVAVVGRDTVLTPSAWRDAPH